MPSGWSVTQSGPALGDPMDCRPPGSSVPRILQARILERVVISFSRGSSWLRDRNCLLHLVHWQADSLHHLGSLRSLLMATCCPQYLNKQTSLLSLDFKIQSSLKFKVYSYIFGSKTWSMFFLSWVWLFSVKIMNRIITGQCPRPTGNMYDLCNIITILHSKIQKILTPTAHLAPRFLNNRLWAYSFKINMVSSGQPLPTPPSATSSSFLPDTLSPQHHLLL